MIVFLIVIFACLILLPAPASAQVRPRQEQDPPFVLPNGVYLIEDVVYGTGGGRELKLDLFLPKAEGMSKPGLVFVHGGGWRGGGRGQFSRHAACMAERGFVGACIEYRLSGEAIFPAAVEDAKCAVRWMRANADPLGIDPDRIGAVGGSAGGHLVAMLGTAGEVSELEGTGGHADFPSCVKAAVPFNGVLDLAVLGKASTRAAEGPIRAFLGGTYGEIPETYTQASPAAHVDESSAAFLLLHGTADETIPFEQSAAFQKRLHGAGGHAELAAYEGAAHGFFNRPPYYEPTLKRMAEFLIAQLGP